jgi:hypothetical protein
MAHLFLPKLRQEQSRQGKPGVHIPPTVTQVHSLQKRLERDYDKRRKHIPAVRQEFDFVLRGDGYYKDRALNAVVRLTMCNFPINS